MNKTFPILYGQPRSGTSMMMRVLEMGGIEIEHHPARDALKQKFRNPYGMFEMPNPTFTKCFKCTSPERLKHLPDTKIIYISRNPEQQAKSWDRITEGKGNNKTRVLKVREIFQKSLIGKEHLHITYEDMHNDPRKECERIKEFLGEFDVENAIKAVDKTLLVIR